MLTHRVTRRVELVHEPGEWIEVRMPSLAILERASQSRAKKAMSLMAGVDMAQLRDLVSPEANREARPDYDPISLLQDCIVSWTYADPVTPENVAELDQRTVDCLLPVLVPEESEEARKNGFGGSISPSMGAGRRR